MATFRLSTHLAATTAALALLAGCTDAATADVADTSGADSKMTSNAYMPFEQANLAQQFVRVAGYHQIRGLSDGADFKAETFGESCAKWNAKAPTPTDTKKIASLYVESAELQTKTKGRKDDHGYNKEAPIGVAIDKTICDAIEAGAKAGAIPRDAIGSIDWHGQTVKKSLLHFYYLSVYHELVEGKRATWDEGVGYYGAALDGGDDIKGLAALMQDVDDNCKTTYRKDIFDLLKVGKGQLDKALTAAGKSGMEDQLSPLPADVSTTIAEIDGKFLKAFALALGHEVHELKTVGGPIELLEGRLFLRVLEPYLTAWDQQKGTQHVATLTALLEQDDPLKAEPQKVLDIIKAVWGVDVESVCK